MKIFKYLNIKGNGLNMFLKIALLVKLGKFPLKCPTAENGLEYFLENVCIIQDNFPLD